MTPDDLAGRSDHEYGGGCDAIAQEIEDAIASADPRVRIRDHGISHTGQGGHVSSITHAVGADGDQLYPALQERRVTLLQLNELLAADPSEESPVEDQHRWSTRIGHDNGAPRRGRRGERLRPPARVTEQSEGADQDCGRSYDRRRRDDRKAESARATATRAPDPFSSVSLRSCRSQEIPLDAARVGMGPLRKGQYPGRVQQEYQPGPVNGM